MQFVNYAQKEFRALLDLYGLNEKGNKASNRCSGGGEEHDKVGGEEQKSSS